LAELKNAATVHGAELGTGIVETGKPLVTFVQ
jgi:hypothetical protein